MYKRQNLGTVPDRFASGKGVFDVERLEWVSWVPLLLLIVVAGFYPAVLTNVTADAVGGLAGIFGA